MNGEPDYIVLHPAPGVSSGPLGEYDGRWYNIAELPPAFGGLPIPASVATPTGRFEFREDGACAEVWQVNITAARRSEAGS